MQKGQPAVQAQSAGSIAPQVINLVAFAFNIACNFFFTINPRNQTIINPAGYAFGIWGVIFLAEGLFTLAQFLPKYRNSPYVVSKSVYLSWAAACVFQGVWVLVFREDLVEVSLVMMIGIFVSLWTLVWSNEKREGEDTELSTLEFIVLVWPFRIHAAWITAASLLNVNIVVLRHHETDVTPQLAAAAAALCFWAAFSQRLNTNITLSAVLVWALVAVYVELNNPEPSIVSLFGISVVDAVQLSVAVEAALLVVFTAVTLLWPSPKDTHVRMDNAPMLSV